MTACRGYQLRRFCPSAYLFLDVRAGTAPRASLPGIYAGWHVSQSPRRSAPCPSGREYISRQARQICRPCHPVAIHRRLIARQALTAGHTVKAYPGDLLKLAFETVIQHPDHDVVINDVNVRLIYVLAVTKTGASNFRREVCLSAGVLDHTQMHLCGPVAEFQNCLFHLGHPHDVAGAGPAASAEASADGPAGRLVLDIDKLWLRCRINE